MAGNMMVLYGKNSVTERLKANPKSIRKVFLQENFTVPDIEKLIKANNISTEHLSPRALSRIKPAKDLQGIAAKVDRFEYTSFYDLFTPLEKDADKVGAGKENSLTGFNQTIHKQLTLIFLDRIYDPQNLGAIIRTAACFGGLAVVIPRYKACEVNETVLHVASGGENYISVSMVSNLSNAIIAAKERGYWIVGAEVGDDAEDINKASMPFPLGIVLGSEGQGVRYGVGKHLDLKVRIPMKGARLSFNVTMACAIFCHEIAKARSQI